MPKKGTTKYNYIKNKNLIDTIVYMNFEENKTYVEIANELNLTKPTIEYHMNSLKKYLNISGVFDLYCYLKYYKPNTLSEIIDKYNKGISSIELGKEYGLSDRTIAEILRKSNVPIRSCGKIPRTDQHIFDVIDNEIKAYTIGLIAADGNITKKGGSISITLTKDDRYVLDQILSELLDGQGHILETKKTTGKNTVTLQFHGMALKNRLADFGVVPNKGILMDKLSTIIPEEYYHHYLRGLYDGDGVCAKYSSHSESRIRVGFCGANKDFVADYQSFFINNLGMARTKLFNTGGCWQCSWSKGADLRVFHDYIYKDATIFLGRKKHKLEKFLHKKKL